MQKTQGLNTQESLREERRSGAIAVVRADDPVDVEPNPAAAEVEERRERELALVIRPEFVAGAVDVEVVVVSEAFGVRQQHDADGESPETELVAGEDFACPANRTTAMLDAKLRRNDEDIITLLLAEFLERGGRAVALLETVGTELAFAVVVELAAAGLLDQIEHLLDGFAVRRGDLLPARDGEPSFGAVGQREAVGVLAVATNAGEQLHQSLHLLSDRLRGVTREIAVTGLDFFVWKVPLSSDKNSKILLV